MRCFKKRLKLTNDQLNIVNHLARNSKAVYNTTLFYSKKILSKDEEIIDQYKLHNQENSEKLSAHRISSFLQNTYANYKFMSNHSSQQSIKRAMKSIKSFFELRKINPKANFPNYLKKDSRYNVFFTKNTSKLIKGSDGYFVRVALGTYVKNNYNNFLKNENINKFGNTYKYYDSRKLKSEKQIIDDIKNRLMLNIDYVFNENGIVLLDADLSFIKKCIHKDFTCDGIKDYFIDKYTADTIDRILELQGKIRYSYMNKKELLKYIRNTYVEIADKFLDKKELIDGRYLYFRIPEYIYNKNIREIEIKPLYNGLEYELILKYKQESKKKTDYKNSLSIDPGINNLMTLFGLKLNPVIVNGRPIKSINMFYKKEISCLQSKMDNKVNKLKEKNKPKKHIKFVKLIYWTKIRRLQDKRSKLINNKFHSISRFFVRYCLNNKIGRVIFGKNKGWKNGTDMGAINNDMFCKIPYNKLVNMISYKLEDNGIVLQIQEESYTSKCDALWGESIRRHQFRLCDEKLGEYVGKRIRRGLFKSAIGTTINADVNGAINIYRKALNLQNNRRGILFNFDLRMSINNLLNIKKYTL
jgi:IS605 OrfB family transposase